jgi:hypothetical protein
LSTIENEGEQKMSTENEQQQNNADVKPVYLAVYAGFLALINGWTVENPDTPLKIVIEGRDCPVTKIHADGMATVELATGEQTVMLNNEQIYSLFRNLARHFDLKIPAFGEIQNKAAAANASSAGDGATGGV